MTFFRDQVGEFNNRFFDRIPRERSRISIEVEGEGLEFREFVNPVRRGINEGWLPEFVCRDG